jgi:hypothetical protein
MKPGRPEARDVKIGVAGTSPATTPAVIQIEWKPL